MDIAVRQFLEGQGYEIGERLGWGGFAEVYRAATPGGVPCAIKVSLDRLDADSPAVKKELENLRLMMGIMGHPNVVGLDDIWVVDG